MRSASVIPKPRLLRSFRKHAVILVGVNAEQCVETTAREAFMRDLDVIVVSDCIGSWSQERLEASKTVVSYAFGAVAESTAIGAAHGRRSRANLAAALIRPRRRPRVISGAPLAPRETYRWRGGSLPGRIAAKP